MIIEISWQIIACVTLSEQINIISYLYYSLCLCKLQQVTSMIKNINHTQSPVFISNLKLQFCLSLWGITHFAFVDYNKLPQWLKRPIFRGIFV